ASVGRSSSSRSGRSDGRPHVRALHRWPWWVRSVLEGACSSGGRAAHRRVLGTGAVDRRGMVRPERPGAVGPSHSGQAGVAAAGERQIDPGGLAHRALVPSTFVPLADLQALARVEELNPRAATVMVRRINGIVTWTLFTAIALLVLVVLIYRHRRGVGRHD